MLHPWLLKDSSFKRIPLIKNEFLLKLNGFIAVSKPKGFTSNDVIQKIKWTLLDACEPDHKSRHRLKSDLKIGHGGTLDPIATGVLGISKFSNCH